jgi:amidase
MSPATVGAGGTRSASVDAAVGAETTGLREGADRAAQAASCLARITEFDPVLDAVLAVNQDAARHAAAADRRQAAGASLGPLDGIPVLVKDNIDTADLATTAGSRVLAACPPPARDAAVVSRLRDAGAVLLGKTNLSEWADFRSYRAPEGWSALGGQTRNARDPERSPAGSSAGSAVAVAAGFAPLALGTETDGSIVCPAGANGVVGVKPEFGLLPLDGVVPVSPEQDTVGVFAARLADAAICLAELTGRADLRCAPVPPSLRGRRLGLWRTPAMPEAALHRVADALERAGAEPVEVLFEDYDELLLDEVLAIHAEFPAAIEAYLRSRPGAPDSLRALIAANRADPLELADFGQEAFEYAAGMSPDELAEAASGGRAIRARAKDALDGALLRHGIEAVLAPTNVAAWKLVPGRPDPPKRTSSTLAALAGYPNISLPAALDHGLPLGISLFGPPRLAALFPLASAVEAATGPAR